jgi:hypothetical protein
MKSSFVASCLATGGETVDASCGVHVCGANVCGIETCPVDVCPVDACLVDVFYQAE